MQSLHYMATFADRLREKDKLIAKSEGSIQLLLTKASEEDTERRNLANRLTEAEGENRRLNQRLVEADAANSCLTGRLGEADAEAARLQKEIEGAEEKAKKRELQAVEDFKSSDELVRIKMEAVDEFLLSERFARFQAQVVEDYKGSEENRASHKAFSQAVYNRAYEKGMLECRNLVGAAHPTLDLSFLEEEADEGEECEEVEEETEEAGAEAGALELVSADKIPAVGDEAAGIELETDSAGMILAPSSDASDGLVASQGVDPTASGIPTPFDTPAVGAVSGPSVELRSSASPTEDQVLT